MDWVRLLSAELAGELESARNELLQRIHVEDAVERAAGFLHLASLDERSGRSLDAAEWYAKAGRELLDAEDLLDIQETEVGNLLYALDAFHAAVVCAGGDDRLQHAIAQEYLPVFEETWIIGRDALAREAVFAALLAERLGDPERAARYFEAAAIALDEEASETGNESAAGMARDAWNACARALDGLGRKERAANIRAVNGLHAPL